MPKKKHNKRIFSTNIPQILERELTSRYGRVVKRYRAADFEHHETSVGKFCEVVLRIFEHLIGGEFTPINQKNPNSEKILNKIISGVGVDASLTRVAPVVRILLGFRNERDAAHVGGFDLEKIDTNFTFYATRWIYAELIRIYSDLDTKKIQQKLDDIAMAEFPNMTEVGNKKIITTPHFTSEKEVLLSLADERKTLEDLFEMNKEQNKTRFKKKLIEMEKRKLVYFDKDQGIYTILPLGKNDINAKK